MHTKEHSSKKTDRKNRTPQRVRYTVVKRNGMLVPFRPDRIFGAIEAAFRETKKISSHAALSQEVYQMVQKTTELVVEEAYIRAEGGACLTVEGIQDLVEVKLMELGHLDVARDYIVYRDHHKVLREDSPCQLKIQRKDGELVRFNPMKIAGSIEEAFRTSQNIEGKTPDPIINIINVLTNKVVEQTVKAAKEGQQLDLHFVQDEIEKQLMKEGYYAIARDVILARAAKHQEEKRVQPIEEKVATGSSFIVVETDGRKTQGLESTLRRRIEWSTKGLEDVCNVEAMVTSSMANLYDGMRRDEWLIAPIMAVKAKIEQEPAYSSVAARLLLDNLYQETMGISGSDANLKKRHAEYFKECLKKGVSYKRIDRKLLSFDLDVLTEAMDLLRDLDFTYLGLQTLYDRYFIHEKGVRLETPQIFWMRVAMGLSLGEGEEKEKRAIEFYNVLSTFHYVSSTPTLFNAGTPHPQLSSCYLLTIKDDLSHIYKTIADNAQLSKWAGGIGDDWTSVRATGSRIKGTNGESQGIVPFLKVANDTAVAVNQGGKRKGAMCAYLEVWHLDIEDFIELRKNTGDERRRTHDMNTAAWIPDLFMKRLEANEQWTLFSPSDVPDLHDLYGKAFEKRYLEYEKEVEAGRITLCKQLDAVDLWRKILSMLFETGHPWITFKDPSNIRSPQDHVGVVHSSNLCTEILLNTSEEETAVCNLGSVNLAKHTTSSGLDKKKLKATITTAMRMLDNVIDINFYPTKEAKTANLRHRPVGLGQMGFQDALYIRGISYASHEAVEFADESQEMISYFAIQSSASLAKERGAYSSYKGSKWDRGILPIDSIALLKQERGEEFVDMDETTRLDWDELRKLIQKHGMRNSNTMAIAPTATIANIVGVTQSIEPMYKHLFVKSNLSGEFTVPNVYLVEKLKELGLWDAEMLDDLKYFDGSLDEIERVPEEIKRLFLTAFEVGEWLIDCASRRQKWIDMGQSLNLYLSEPSGKRLDMMYKEAWKKGCKTTYYLRSLAATQVEKATTDANKRGLQPRWMKNESASSRIQIQRGESLNKDGQDRTEKLSVPVCNLEEGCESCQ